LNCFIGSQAIDWLCRGVKGLGSVDRSLEGERGEFAGSNRKRARSIMNVMLRQEYIRHACNNSGMFQGEYFKRRERASRNESTVVDIYIPPPSFKPLSLSLSRSSLSKTPKQVFFNPINIFDSFTHSITVL